MYVHVCECMHMCVHVCACVYMCVHVCTCVHTLPFKIVCTNIVLLLKSFCIEIKNGKMVKGHLTGCGPHGYSFFPFFLTSQSNIAGCFEVSLYHVVHALG